MVGGIAIIALLFLLLFLWRRRQKKERDGVDLTADDRYNVTPATYLNPAQATNPVSGARMSFASSDVSNIAGLGAGYPTGQEKTPSSSMQFNTPTGSHPYAQNPYVFGNAAGTGVNNGPPGGVAPQTIVTNRQPREKKSLTGINVGQGSLALVPEKQQPRTDEKRDSWWSSTASGTNPSEPSRYSNVLENRYSQFTNMTADTGDTHSVPSTPVGRSISPPLPPGAQAPKSAYQPLSFPADNEGQNQVLGGLGEGRSDVNRFPTPASGRMLSPPPLYSEGHR